MASSKGGTGGKALISDAPLSESSASTKSRALDIFSEMRESTPELKAAYPSAFERLPETTICSREFYHEWGTFLTEYKSSKVRYESGHLAPGTALGYFGALLQIAGGLHAQKGSQESRDFLSCLLPKSQTASAHWYKRVRLNIHTTLTTRAAKDGEELDHSAAPVSVEHLSLVSRAYSLNGSEEAAERKMAISTLRSAAGRASEAGLVNWDGMECAAHPNASQMPACVTGTFKSLTHPASVALLTAPPFCVPGTTLGSTAPSRSFCSSRPAR